MARCSFCDRVLPHGTGKLFVHKDGKVLTFCSSKCERNMLRLKRRGQTTKWTTAFKKLHSSKKRGVQ